MSSSEVRFIAHVRDGAGAIHRALPGATSFVEAAVLFAEEASINTEERLSVEITDRETGKTRCFMIELETAAVHPC